MMQQRCIIFTLGFLFVSTVVSIAVFSFVLKRVNISIAEPVPEGRKEVATNSAVSDFALTINSNRKEGHFLRQEETKETMPPIVRSPKFANPVEEDFPCLHFPLPPSKEPFLFLFVNFTQRVLLALGVTLIDNCTELKAHIQHNTLAMLHSLKPAVFPVLFSNNSYWLRRASLLGIYCTNDFLSNEFGTPFFFSMMQTLETRIPSTFVGYMNGDLLFHSASLLSSLNFIASSFLPDHPNVMIMGRRYNRDMSLEDDWSKYSSFDFDRVIENEIAFSDLFITVAQDYFIYTHQTLNYLAMEDVVIGRNGIDNYLLDFCIRNQIALIDASAAIFVLHQTDADGNWAGSRESLDRDWNLRIVQDSLVFDSLSQAPFQLNRHEDGSLSLHRYRKADNVYSREEMEFISKFLPAGADRLDCLLDSEQGCLYYGKGLFVPFFEGRCDRFDVFLYDIFQKKYAGTLEKTKYNVVYRHLNVAPKQSSCMNYRSYLTLPTKRAVFYDVVIIDGLCRQYSAFYVLSRLKRSDSPVLIRGLELFQYRNLSSFIEKYYDKIECLEPFPNTEGFDYVGFCAYRAKPAGKQPSESLPLWW